MTFGHPLLLLTLLAVPATLLLHALAQRRRMRYTVRFTNLDVLARVAQRRSWRRVVAPLLFLLALTALGIAVARPRVSTRVPVERATVILVIDVSRSMDADDVRPTRLAAAQAAARSFLTHVPKRLRVGLVVFAGEPQVALTPTTDHDLARRSLTLLGTETGFGGTAIGDALARAVRLGLRAVTDDPPAGQAPAPPAPRRARGLVSILFLSDGRQNRGVLPPLAGAARARAAGIPVYTVALGTTGGSLGGGGGGGFRGGGFQGGFGGGLAPDPATLRAIARETGGRFTRARTAETLEAAYAKLGSRLGRRPGRKEITYEIVAAAAALLVAAGAFAWTWSPRLP